METLAIITGATRNLGLALARGLPHRLEAGDVVYLTGPTPERVAHAVEASSTARAEIRVEVLDVADQGAVARLSTELVERHGGVDLVFSNHYAR